MPNINITVAAKIATNTTPGEVIVCGNSDYTVTFAFDSEWDAETERTARFVYYKDGLSLYQDVAFTGDAVAVPVLSNISYVLVGVYAGNLHTTTPAKVLCDRSILCGDPLEVLTPEEKAKLQAQIGDLSKLQTTDKSNLVAAINVLVEDGVSKTAADLLITILRNGVYSTDQSANITALETALASGGSGGEGEPDNPDEPHTHSYTATVTTAATCETAGVRTYTCSCGHSYTEEIPATGHNYVDGTCTNCGAADPDAGTGGVDWVSGAEVEFTVIPDEYVAQGTGAFVPEANGYDRTDYIFCYGAGHIGYSGEGSNFCAFYDLNKQYISTFSIGMGTTKYAEIPENAVYFIISASTLDNAIIKLYEKVEPTWTSGEAYTFTFVENEYVSNGVFTAYSSWKRTDYVNCAGASKLTKTNASAATRYCAFYNAEKELMSVGVVALPDTTNGAADLLVPVGACYFVASESNAYMDALVLVPYA